MIKILKNGNPKRKAKRVYTHNCENCGCVFEYDYEYILLSDSSVECPCCRLHSISDKDKYRIEVEE